MDMEKLDLALRQYRSLPENTSRASYPKFTEILDALGKAGSAHETARGLLGFFTALTSHIEHYAAVREEFKRLSAI